MSEPVYCEDCDSAITRLDGKQLHAYRWLCLAKPVPEIANFVSREWRLTEPYERCKNVNTRGDCQHFTPKRHTGDNQ